MRQIIGSLLFLCIFSGCEMNSSSRRVRQLSLYFKEERVIGNNRNQPEEFFFTSPSEISMARTDNAGNIYVSDLQSHVVRVYDSKGNFLRSIGGPGKGPGEFTNISAITLNQRNELVVLDYSNQRITWFSISRGILSSRMSSRQTMVWPNSFCQLDNGDYLLLQKPRDIPDSGDPKQQHFHSCVFHLYDRNFHYLTSFGNIDSLMDTRDASNEFVRFFTSIFNPGHFWSVGVGRGEIWYAPGIYEGHIFKFQEGPHGWKIVKTVQGYIPTQHPVDLDPNPHSPSSLSITVFGSKRPHKSSGRINSVDLGLFVLNDGRLINFSLERTNGKRMSLMVEVFSTKDKLEGIGQLKNFTFPVTAKTFLNGYLKDVLWKDQKDRFYFIDRRDTTPVIRIGHIDGI